MDNSVRRHIIALKETVKAAEEFKAVVKAWDGKVLNMRFIKAAGPRFGFFHQFRTLFFQYTPEVWGEESQIIAHIPCIRVAGKPYRIPAAEILESVDTHIRVYTNQIERMEAALDNIDDLVRQVRTQIDKLNELTDSIPAVVREAYGLPGKVYMR